MRACSDDWLGFPAACLNGWQQERRTPIFFRATAARSVGQNRNEGQANSRSAVPSPYVIHEPETGPKRRCRCGVVFFRQAPPCAGLDPLHGIDDAQKSLDDLGGRAEKVSITAIPLSPYSFELHGDAVRSPVGAKLGLWLVENGPAPARHSS